MPNTIPFFKSWMHFAVILCLCHAVSAQKSEKVDISEFTATNAVVRFSTLYPFVQGEFRIAPTTTFKASGTIYTPISAPNQLLVIRIIPVLNVGVHQYLNVRSRISKGKRVDNFSANYVYAAGTLLFYEDPVLAISAGYGLTRNIGRLGFWRTFVGVSALNATDAVSVFIPDLGLAIGLCLPIKNIKD